MFRGILGGVFGFYTLLIYVNAACYKINMMTI